MKKANYVAPSTDMVLFINKSYTCDTALDGNYQMSGNKPGGGF